MIDSCIAIQLYLPTPLDIFINQFNRNFSEIDTVLFVSSFLCSPKESLKDIHSTLAVFISALTDTVPGII